MWAVSRAAIVESILSFTVLVWILSVVVWLDDRVSDQAGSMAQQVHETTVRGAAVGGGLADEVFASFRGDSGSLLHAFVTISLILVLVIMRLQHRRS